MQFEECLLFFARSWSQTVQLVPGWIAEQRAFKSRRPSVNPNQNENHEGLRSPWSRHMDGSVERKAELWGVPIQGFPVSSSTHDSKMDFGFIHSARKRGVVFLPCFKFHFSTVFSGRRIRSCGDRSRAAQKLFVECLRNRFRPQTRWERLSAVRAVISKEQWEEVTAELGKGPIIPTAVFPMADWQSSAETSQEVSSSGTLGPDLSDSSGQSFNTTEGESLVSNRLPNSH